MNSAGASRKSDVTDSTRGSEGITCGQLSQLDGVSGAEAYLQSRCGFTGGQDTATYAVSSTKEGTHLAKIIENAIGGLLFKCGPSPSKVFGIIERFSEDVDLSFDRAGLGFAGDNDPFNASSGKKQNSTAGETSYLALDHHDFDTD